MSNTIQTSPSSATPGAASAGVEVKVPVVQTRSFGWYAYRGLKALASLRLTVVLFALSLLLVFFGTLAQIDSGIWTVVNHYFRWFWVWVPFQLLVQFGQKFFALPESLRIPGSFPYPGGWTLGALLLINLLAAHAVRFKLSLKRSGILLTHAGLVVMLLGEFATAGAVEGNMVIEEGETSNVVTQPRYAELAVISPDPNAKQSDHVTVVPGGMLRKGGTISSPELPFDIEVVKWLVNARLRTPREGEQNLADAGFGKQRVAADVGEVSGVDTNQTYELPACYLVVKKKDGTPLGTYLMSLEFNGQTIVVDGKSYDVALRIKQSHKPYSLQLLEFRYDRYPGTNTAKNFSSKVRLIDPEVHEDREVTIRMNEPLRHRGETFYQSGWNQKTERGTVLQVVRNPVWTLPYISCFMVSLGMVIHFGITLVTFLQRRAGA